MGLLTPQRGTRLPNLYNPLSDRPGKGLCPYCERTGKFCPGCAKGRLCPKCEKRMKMEAGY